MYSGRKGGAGTQRHGFRLLFRYRWLHKYIFFAQFIQGSEIRFPAMNTLILALSYCNFDWTFKIWLNIQVFSPTIKICRRCYNTWHSRWKCTLLCFNYLVFSFCNLLCRGKNWNLGICRVSRMLNRWAKFFNLIWLTMVGIRYAWSTLHSFRCLGWSLRCLQAGDHRRRYAHIF